MTPGTRSTPEKYVRSLVGDRAKVWKAVCAKPCRGIWKIGIGGNVFSPVPTVVSDWASTITVRTHEIFLGIASFCESLPGTKSRAQVRFHSDALTARDPGTVK